MVLKKLNLKLSVHAAFDPARTLRWPPYLKIFTNITKRRPNQKRGLAVSLSLLRGLTSLSHRHHESIFVRSRGERFKENMIRSFRIKLQILWLIVQCTCLEEDKQNHHSHP